MRTKDYGFTLIELILVMALIMILSVIGIGSYTQATVKARDTQRKNDLNQISKALEAFNNDLGRYPKSDTTKTPPEMKCPSCSGEITCIGKIEACPVNQSVIYMQKVPTDPTSGKYYRYESASTDGYSTYSLFAALDNPEDRDIVTSSGNKTDWAVSCGSGVMCNYKITETGLIRTK